MSAVEPDRTRRTWRAKFADAFRGLMWGVRGQSSFAVHLPMAVLVVGLAAWLRVSRWEWGLLSLCIAAVLVAEMLNSSLESMAKAVEDRHNVEIGRALDVASAAVLLAAIGAAVVGMIVFLPHLWQIYVQLAG